MFLTILLVLIPILFLWDYASKKKRYELTARIPGPKVYPFIGNLFILRQKNTEEAVALMVGNIKEFGSIVRVWIINQLVILIADPKALEVIMGSPKYIRKNSLYDILSIWLGTGLLISNGRKWFSRRKIITPAFHFKILDDFVEIFDEQSAVFVENLKTHVDKKSFDINPYITLCALDVISETAMGTKINAQTNPNCEYARAVTDMTDILMCRFVKYYYKNDFLFKLFAPGLKRQQDSAMKTLHDFTENIIEERRRSLLHDNNAENEEQDDIGTKRKMALLDVLLQSTVDGKPLGNEDIREEVDTFMFEGHDTTTAGIGFTLYCISRHPDVQAKIFAEIRSVIGDDKTASISMHELNELKYLELVIKESMRLFPPVPVIGRRLEQEVVINGSTIPPETDITIPIFAILRDPKLFPNPEKFDPERHSIENNQQKPNPYAYIPFSAGPRNCIGQKFAMLEMKSTVSKILRHYELLALGEPPQQIINIVLRSKNGINLGIKNRIYQ